MVSQGGETPSSATNNPSSSSSTLLSSSSSNTTTTTAIMNHRPFPKPLPCGITFSFSAGGWLQMYMFGVCHALQQSGVIDHYNSLAANSEEQQQQSQQSSNKKKEKSASESSTPREVELPPTPTPMESSNTSNNNNNNSSKQPVRFVGASAGALAASCLAGDIEMNEVREFTLECAEHMNSKWWHYFFMKDYVDIAIDKFAADIMSQDSDTGSTETQDRLRKSLGIYCTVLPWFQKKKFNEFASVEDVKEALFASLCAAPMVGFPFRLRSTGELVVDGGITSFQPKSGRSNVITVSPFYFANADIRPSQFLPVHWAFKPPSSRKAHAALFDLGYNDAIDYLVRKQYIAPQNTSNIRRPDPKTPRRGVFAIFKDFTFLLFSYILLRPVAIVVVYLEMMIMASYYFVRTLVYSSSNRGATFVDWLETVANLCSPSVFMRMAVSHRIPVNEKRLSKRSITFRVFAPIFGTPDDEDGQDNDDDDLNGGNGKKKKRFAVHTPVGAPNQTQVLFDRFRNLGWSNGQSMFKEEDGRVVKNDDRASRKADEEAMSEEKSSSTFTFERTNSAPAAAASAKASRKKKFATESSSSPPLSPGSSEEGNNNSTNTFPDLSSAATMPSSKNNIRRRKKGKNDTKSSDGTGEESE